MDFSEIVRKRLKQKLIESGMTQKELAIKAGITEVTISRYISGSRTPKLTTLYLISEALGCPIDELLSVE